MVSRHKEENIFKINYDKHMVPISLSFKGIRGDTLKADTQVEAQIGSEYNPIAYDKISSENGERWMIAKTDPENMFVREGSRFTLYYDEIKARVIVKCVNIADNMSIVNDQMIITKLGGVFVPNIQQKVYDKHKMRWNYVGEPAMSIVAKENEQENIITLKYEPDMRDVTIKFLNNFSQTVHPDVVKAEQVGSNVAIKQYEKIIEDNGMGWKLIDISRTSITVDEDENKNIITQTYAPLIEDVAVRYIDNDGNELTQSLIEKVQVGQTYTAKILPTVTDNEGKVWQYANIPVEPHKMVDGPNKINIKYEPLLAPITFTYHMTDGQEIIQDKVITIQVGTNYEVKPQERVIDAEGKYWKLVNVSKRSLIVSQTPDYNLVQETYEPDFTNVVLVFASEEGKELTQRKQLNLQIGSTFNIERQEVIEDSDGLSWLVSKENPRDAKVSEDQEKNTITIKYDPLLANVFYCFAKEDADEEIIEPEAIPRQVGTFYSAEVKDEIKDGAGRVWIFSAQANKEPVKDGKYGRIKVYSDESRNKLFIKYAKKVADVTVEYLDNLGNSLKPKETLKLQIGSRFSENIPKKIVDRDGNSWKFNPKSIVDIVVSEVPSENVVNLSYEESKGTVTYKFITITGESIREDTEELAQIGSHFTPKFDKIITLEDGRVWEFKETDKESLTVDEEDANNVITLTYMPLKVDVLVNYVDLWKNDVIEPKIEKAQLGSKFRLEIEKEFKDPQGKLYYVKEIKPEEILIKEKPLGAKKNPNEITIVFEPINSDVIIKYRDSKGGIIRGDDKVHIQVGSHYTPEPPEYIKDDKGIEWQLLEATKDEIIISPNPEENTLVYSYDVAQANVLLRYVSIDGLTVKPEEHVPMQVGQTYVAKPEHTVLDKDNKKWSLINIKPTTLIVGSINNIVTITYQEEKARVTLRYVDEKGTVIRAEETTDAQIGSKFVPKITNKVIYNASEIWKIVKTNPEFIIVSEDINENTVDLVYSNSNAGEKEELKETKTSVFEEVNPFANTLSAEDKEIVDKMTQAEEAKKAGDNKEEEFEFEDPNLKRLAATMKLSLSEKQAINELNDLNIQIVAELRKSNEAYKAGQTIYDYSTLESLIENEKSHISKNLSSLITQDKSGARLLKVMEAIVASESNDKIFGKLEQRKAVIVTDFFIDKALESTDKAIYICERGKNTQELALIDDTLSDRRLKDKSDAIRMKTALYYEKLLLDNYFKARSPETDNYFESESARSSLGDDVMTVVENMLVRQFANACGREPFDLEQQSEAKAIAKIATPSIRTKLQKKIDSLDNRARRNAQQSMKG
jgi:hypothetical protein